MTPENFVSLVSHDLRAPLRGLKTLPDMARAELEKSFGEVPHDLCDILEMMSTQANRLDTIVREVTQYARLARSEATPETPVSDVLGGQPSQM